ncbi:MAG: hypothetical protein ACI4S4_02525 [Candidatus Ornithospirochaeta sp.]
MTASEVAQALGVSSRSIEMNVMKLKDLGFLVREGPRENGFWKLVAVGKNQNGFWENKQSTDRTTACSQKYYCQSSIYP